MRIAGLEFHGFPFALCAEVPHGPLTYRNIPIHLCPQSLQGLYIAANRQRLEQSA